MYLLELNHSCHHERLDVREHVGLLRASGSEMQDAGSRDFGSGGIENDTIRCAAGPRLHFDCRAGGREGNRGQITAAADCDSSD